MTAIAVRSVGCLSFVVACRGERVTVAAAVYLRSVQSKVQSRVSVASLNGRRLCRGFEGRGEGKVFKYDRQCHFIGAGVAPRSYSRAPSWFLRHEGPLGRTIYTSADVSAARLPPTSPPPRVGVRDRLSSRK